MDPEGARLLTYSIIGLRYLPDAIRDSSVILDIHKTVKIIFVCLTATARVIFNWRLTNVLTN